MFVPQGVGVEVRGGQRPKTFCAGPNGRLLGGLFPPGLDWCCVAFFIVVCFSICFACGFLCLCVPMNNVHPKTQEINNSSSLSSCELWQVDVLRGCCCNDRNAERGGPARQDPSAWRMQVMQLGSGSTSSPTKTDSAICHLRVCNARK